MKTDYDPLYKWKYINIGDGSEKENIRKIKAKNNSSMKEMHESFYKNYKSNSKDSRLNTTNSVFANTFRNNLQPMMTNSAFFSNSNFFTNTSTTFKHPGEHKIKTSNSHNFMNTTSTDFNLHIISPNMTIRDPNRTIKSNSFTNSFLSHFNTTKNLELKDVEPLSKLYYMNEGEKVLNKLSAPGNFSKEDEQFILKKFNIMTDQEEREINQIRNTFRNKNNSKDEKAILKLSKHDARCVEYFYDDPITSKIKLKLNNEIFSNMMAVRTYQQNEKYEKIQNENFLNYMKIAHMPKIKEINTEKHNPNSNNPFKKSSKTHFNKYKESMSPVKQDFKNKEEDVELLNLNKGKKFWDKSDKIKKDQTISREHLLLNVNLNCFNLDVKYKPNSRSLFSLNLIRDKLVIFGGINSCRLNDIWICDIENKFKWEKINIDEKNSPVPRNGHTSIVYKNEIYIYGGSTPVNYFHTPEELVIFNLSMGTFYTPGCMNKTEIQWRRNHVALTVGNFMFINGGIANDEKFLSDSIIFEFSSRRWHVVEIKGNKPPGLAYHSIELVVGFDTKKHSNFNIYHLPDLPNNTAKITKIKRQGIYLFGGMDENRNYTNDIRILKLGRKPTKWLFPKTHGIPPLGRMNASMNLYSELNFLVIHGGRNDKERISIFNDIFLLDLEKLNWIKVEKCSTAPIKRTEHRSFIYEDKLLILGGNDLTNLVKFDFYVISLDLYSSKRMSMNINIRTKERLSIPDIKKEVKRKLN